MVVTVDPPVIEKQSNNDFQVLQIPNVRFTTQGGYISQTITVKGNSVYEIVTHGSSLQTFRQLQLEVEAYTTRNP